MDLRGDTHADDKIGYDKTGVGFQHGAWPEDETATAVDAQANDKGDSEARMSQQVSSEKSWSEKISTA